MATPARSFIDTYNNEITELKRHFMGYVKALRASDVASRSAAQGDSTQIRLEMTSDGFPILPTPWKGSQYKKKELEEWFKLYVCWAALQYDHFLFNELLLICMQN
jgi:hypothetical protein